MIPLALVTTAAVLALLVLVCVCCAPRVEVVVARQRVGRET